MHKVLKDNPKTSITAVLSFIVALGGGGFAGYDSIQDIATKAYVDNRVDEVQIQLVKAEIMRYETELMKIAFLTETNEANAIDRLMKTKAEQQLQHLRARLSDLRARHNKHK